MKKLLAGLGAIILLGAGCSSAPSTVQTNQPVTQVKSESTVASYTMTEVAAANTEQKCWTVVSGKVYDLTGYILRHPGGKPNIMVMCGKDASAAYEAQHGGQRRPERELAPLQIGILK